jgi:hypothetical protein
MNIDFDNLVWLFILVVGLLFFLIGIKAIKIAKTKQAGILSVFMSGCVFILFILEILIKTLNFSSAWADLFSKIKLIICGVWLGVGVVMHITGCFKLLKEAKANETSKNDSQNND